MSSFENPVAGEVENILSAEPGIEWETNQPEKVYNVFIHLLRECRVVATMKIADDGTRSAYIDMLVIPEHLRGKNTGIARRLLEILKIELQKYGVREISAYVTSKGALVNLTRVFGPLSLFNYVTHEPVTKKLEEILEEGEDDGTEYILHAQL